MMHTVDFPTRFQNGHSSATDNIFVSKSRMLSYVIFPLSNALSDHEAQCKTLNNFFLDTKVKNGKYKNKFRLIMSKTVNYFQEQLSQETWENVFSTNDVNSSFNRFLSTFLIKFEASFSYICLSNNRNKVGLPKASENLVNKKEVCIS